MTPYMMMLVFQKKHGLNVMVDRNIKEWITRYFVLPNSDRIPVLEEYFCPRALASIKQHMLNYTQNDPARTEKEVLELKVSGKVVNFWPEGSEEEASYWVPDAILVTYGTFIRKEFLFRPEYQNYVDNMLRTLAENEKSGKELVFIGMHARRTDYIAFSKKILKKSISGKTHFLEGIEHFQEEFPDHKVIFLAVSDDMRWMSKQLGGISGVVLAGAGLAGTESGLDPIGVDLCLLSSSNHSIISQGQYGLWGSFLAAGDIFSEYGPMIRSVLID